MEGETSKRRDREESGGWGMPRASPSRRTDRIRGRPVAGVRPGLPFPDAVSGARGPVPHRLCRGRTMACRPGGRRGDPGPLRGESVRAGGAGKDPEHPPCRPRFRRLPGIGRSGVPRSDRPGGIHSRMEGIRGRSPRRPSLRHHRARRDESGLSLLSRHPLEELRILRPEGTAVPDLPVQVRLEGGSVRLMVVHPLPPVRARSTERRNRRLARLSGMVGRGPVPAVGDFDTTPWNHAFARLPEESAPKRSGGSAPTRPAGPAPMRLPWIIALPGGGSA